MPGGRWRRTGGAPAPRGRPRGRIRPVPGRILTGSRQEHRFSAGQPGRAERIRRGAVGPTMSKGGSRVTLPLRPGAADRRNGAMTPIPDRRAPRRTPKSTREPPFRCCRILMSGSWGTFSPGAAARRPGAALDIAAAQPPQRTRRFAPAGLFPHRRTSPWPPGSSAGSCRCSGSRAPGPWTPESGREIGRASCRERV